MTARDHGTPPPRAVFTIAADTSFVDALAAGVLARAAGDVAALPRYRILLPTRRGCRALVDAFLRQSDGQPLLLPRISPLADVDEDELALGTLEEEGLACGLEVPPAISGVRRQLLLTRLILASGRDDATPEQAARLAAELARLLDQVHTEGLEFARLKDLVPAHLAAHWQITLDFLELVTESWPRILAEEGCIDPADRRNRLLRAQADAWRTSPPSFPVIAAGSTGSIAATADLLDVVSRLPGGAVVLPGLDKAADDASWQALEPSHPEYAMAQLLDRFGVDRQTVAPWPTPIADSGAASRAAVVMLALRPAATADQVRGAALPDDALRGVGRIDAGGPEEEARAIALIMRGTLEDAGKTAALVTADRDLARRVGAELERWGIAVDDSAGRPLAQTPPGVFLRLTAAMVVEDLAPVPLLAALKHPLAACGLAPAVFRARVRRLETTALRGPRPAPGIGGLRAAIETRTADVDDLIERLAQAIRPLSAVVAAGTATLATLLRAHVLAAEALAAGDRESGADRLWGGDAGTAAAACLAEIDTAATDFPAFETSVYPALLDTLLIGRVVRPRYGRHPRLAIWGPLEARLQRADVMILGGLNEDTWPPRAEPSPWMSRGMMKAFGLPLPERRVGLSAHDFAQAFGAPEVWLTRATRVEGSPTVPSRWLLRLDNLCESRGWPDLSVTGARWLAWQRALDQPDTTRPWPSPTPRPPLAARPRRLPVTAIETWLRDPYAIYARYVLGLTALDGIDLDPGAAEYGQFVHNALDRFVRETPRPWPPDALDRLLTFGRQTFGDLLARPGIAAFWWPRFERIAAWFLSEEAKRGAAATFTEVKGARTLSAPGGPFEITARADRIDVDAGGRLTVIDYKTGYVPSAKEIKAGFAPQLPLEAAIALDGGFPGVNARPVASLQYWRLRGGEPAGEITVITDEPEALADEALKRFAELVDRFDHEDTPYLARPRPSMAPRFSDYEHLARIKEWTAAAEGESE